MDTRELLTFVTVCETLNYQKAAERLQYAPSTLFKHVQQLEAELGAPLLVREGRQLRVTQEGLRFHPYAVRMLAEYHAALGIEEESAGALTVGGCEMNTGNSLIEMFTRFAKAHPGIRLDMMTSPNAKVPEMVRSGQVDIGFYYGTGRGQRGLRLERLYREPVSLVVPRQSPLAEAEGLRYEDLAGMEFVYPHDTCCFVTMLMPRLEQRGMRLKSVAYLGGMQLVVEQARRDGAVTLAPERALPRFRETYGLVPLRMQEEPITAWETILLPEHEENAAARALRDFAESEAKRFLRMRENEEKVEAAE